MKAFLLATLSLAFGLAKPLCGGILSGFMKINGNATNCNYVDIAQPQGTITRQVPFPPCTDVTGASQGKPLTTFSYDEHAFFFMTGQGQYVWWVDDSTVEYKTWVSMPTHYDFPIGMVPIVDQGLYIATTTSLYYVAEPLAGGAPVLTTLMNLTVLELDNSALFAGDFWNPYLYIIQGNQLIIFDFTVQTKPVISEVTLTLNNITELAVYDSDNAGPISLVTQVGTKLYLIDNMKGTATYLQDLATVPISNSVGPDTYFYADATKLYSLDLTTGKVLTTAPFAGANLEGFFQFHP